jgi:DNA-binding MarR family transcriptional regulator
VLAVTGRDIRDARYALRWDALTSSWQCEGNADQLELTERQQELLETLRSLGTATVSELSKAVGADRANTYRRLNELCYAGLIKRVDIHGVTAYQVV